MPCHEHQVPSVDHDPFRLSPDSWCLLSLLLFGIQTLSTPPGPSPAAPRPTRSQVTFRKHSLIPGTSVPLHTLFPLECLNFATTTTKKNFFFFQDSQHPGKHFSTSGAQLFFPTWFRSLWCYNYLGVFICQGKECLQGQDPGLIHSLSFPLTQTLT